MGILRDKAGGTRLCSGETQRWQHKGTSLVELATWGHTDLKRNHILLPKIKPINFFSKKSSAKLAYRWGYMQSMILGLSESKKWAKELNQSTLGRTKRRQSRGDQRRGRGEGKKGCYYLSKPGVITHTPEKKSQPMCPVQQFSSGQEVLLHLLGSITILDSHWVFYF